MGQRQGLGIGGLKTNGHARGTSLHAPWFVARKDMAANTLWAVQGHDHPWLLSQQLQAQNASWVAGHAPSAGAGAGAASAYAAKARYRQADALCRIQTESDTVFTLDFPAPQWAVTPGQSAVLYDGDICLGGGVIA